RGRAQPVPLPLAEHDDQHLPRANEFLDRAGSAGRVAAHRAVPGLLLRPRGRRGLGRRAAALRRSGRRRGPAARRERPARGCDGPDRARRAVARERAPDRRLPATDPHDSELARPSARWPLGAPPLPGLPSDLVRVLGSRARVEAALEPAKLALKLAPAVETLPRERSAPKRLADCAAGLALVRAIAEATGRG